MGHFYSMLNVFPINDFYFARYFVYLHHVVADDGVGDVGYVNGD